MCAYRRNINASSDKKSNEDIFAEQLTENVIQCLKGMKDSNWEKGWATASFIGNPENIEGRQYSGNNRLILFPEPDARHDCEHSWRDAGDDEDDNDGVEDA